MTAATLTITCRARPPYQARVEGRAFRCARCGQRVQVKGDTQHEVSRAKG